MNVLIPMIRQIMRTPTSEEIQECVKGFGFDVMPLLDGKVLHRDDNNIVILVYYYGFIVNRTALDGQVTSTEMDNLFDLQAWLVEYRASK